MVTGDEPRGRCSFANPGLLKTRSTVFPSLTAALAAAERCGACKHAWHTDGTELAPKLERGWMLVPAGMVERARRVA